MIHMTAPTLAIVAFMAFTGYTWLRLDSLADRRAVAGPRRRRVLARQMGAMVGWWLVCTGATLLAFGGSQLALTFAMPGGLIVVLAIVAKARQTAPAYWSAP